MSTDIELYPRDQNDFSHHGYALDDISNDIVTWQLNAKFTLTFDYPMFSEHAGDLVAENIVRVPVPGGKAAFRIAQVIKSMGHLSITAYHVFWDLNDDFIADTNIVDKDGQGALDQIMRAANYPTGFKVLSTIGNVTNARLVRMSIIKALLGTDDNSFLNRWGGEFDWQDFSFSVNPRLGKDRGVHFEYAHNLTGYEATKDSSGIITRLLPEGYNGLLLPELYVDSPKLGNYRKPKIGTKTYQDIKAIDETQATGDQEGAVSIQEAYELLRAAAAKEFSESHIDEARWTYKLNVALLENTEEYKDLSITTTVLPGDTVTITHKLDGIDVRARLTGYTWQPSNHSYLTQTYDSTSRPDVAYSNLSSRVNEIKSQIELVDKVVIAKAANGMNSTGWGDQSPVDLNIAGKTGDVYYQTTAKGTIMWLFHDGQWNAETGDAFGTEVQKKVDDTIADVAAADANLQVAKQDIADLQVKLKANDDTQAQLTKDLAANSTLITKNKADVDAALDTVDKTLSQAKADTATAVKNADSAVANAQSAVGASGLATASAQSAVATANSTASEFGPVKQKADSAVASALSAQSDASAAVAQASSAAADSKDAKQIAGAVSQSYKTLTDGSTMTIAELQNGLAVKLTKDDLSGYATQTWAQNQITANANGLEAKLSTVQTSLGARNLVVDSEFLDTSNLWMISTYTGATDFSPGVDGSGSFRTLLFNYSSFSDAKWSFAKSQKVDVTAIATLSASVRVYTAPTDASTGAELQIEWYDSTGKIVSSGTAATESAAGLQGRWQTITSENVSKPTGAVTASLVIFVRQNGRYWFSYPMMNAGTTVADYHPGVADSSQFATLKLAVDGFSTTFAKQTDLQTVSTKTNTTADGLSAVVAVTGTKGEKVTKVIADVNAIQSTMSAKGGLTTRLQTLEGFQQTATNTLAGVATTSQVTQLATQLTSSIGARNLVTDSDFSDIDNTWMISTYSSSTTTRNDFRQGVDGGGAGNTLYFQGTNFSDAKWSYAKSRSVSAQSYTKLSASVMVWSTDLDSGAALKIEFYDSADQVINDGVNVAVSDNSKVNAWQTIKTENVAVPSNAVTVRLTLFVIKNGNFSFLHPMMNAGTTALLYSASGVAQSQITQLKGLIDQRVLVDGKIAAALSLSADGGGTVTIQGASLYVTAASHFDDASIQSAAIANLDAAKITSGSIAADRLATTNLNADNITSGSIDAARIATTALSATNITSGTLDVGKLTVKNLSADLIASGTIDASKIAVKNLSASNIIGGELNALLVNVTNLNADKITTGTLNAANVNVINLNASAIVTGTISGANLAINLNTGMVEFQKGRIHSTDNNIDINIDQKYISVTDSNNSVLLKGGSMTFTQPYAFDTDQTPYLTIDNVGSSQTLGRGAEIVGRDVLTVSVSGENNSFLSGVPLFQKDFSGISISKNYDTVVGGANRGVRIIGGGSYSTGLGMSTVPSIMVGYNNGGVTGGTRINIEADYVQIPSAWSKTTSSSPNAFVASDGALVRSTSASKYKVNIERTRSTDLAERLLTVPNAHWLDKAAMERYASGEQKELPQTNFGLIAEDLEAAGLEDLVVRGPDGELEGIQYDRIAAALLPLLAQMKTEIDELKATA